jgi:hypothetical protein
MMASGGVPRLTIRKLLNHVETGVTAICDRHSYDPEKKAALILVGSEARCHHRRQTVARAAVARGA